MGINGIKLIHINPKFMQYLSKIVNNSSIFSQNLNTISNLRNLQIATKSRRDGKINGP